MDSQFFQELITKYLDGSASPEEKAVVENYYEKLSTENKYVLSREQQQKLDQAIFGAPVRTIYRTWMRVAAAVLILLGLGTASWFIFGNKDHQVKDIASLSQAERFRNDINPANNSAVLLTEEGNRITLDSTADGKLIAGHTTLTKADNSLTYTSITDVYYHTISTGKGKEYHLTLVDGTEVWLDAQSSIRFPTAFPGDERKVEVTGQAYFEVAKNKAKPFKVIAGGVETKVLGTHFNVNSYAAAVVTLIEGAVAVTKDDQTLFISPGQQAALVGQRLSMNKNPDLDQTMAWHTGKFRFKGATVEQIMMQISRWYDIEVVFQDKVSETFVARIARDVPVSRLLNLLEMTKQVAFTIEGNKITVLKPK